jgi:large subunit ribosomal protein L18
MNIIKNKTKQRLTRIRKAIAKVSDRPRLSISRSNKYCYAQIIDLSGTTIVGISEKAVAGDKKLSTMDSAKQVGLAIAKMALEKKIKTVVFDKGSLSYHGRVKAIAEGAREGGLQF